MFLDESALLLSPLRRRTWAPRGKPPVLPARINGRRKVSLIGALAVDPTHRKVEFMFQVLKDENVTATRFVSFLHALLLTLRGNLIVVLDNLAVHRANVVSRLVRSNRRRLSLVYLPPYAPELNPVEYVWSDLKYHRLSNYAPSSLDALEKKAVEVGIQISLEQQLLRGCLSHSSLKLWRA